MAGSHPGFNAAEFRDGIRTVMGMASPEESQDEALFFFPDERVPADADSSGQPFDWVAEPVGAPPRPAKKVLCIIDPYEKPTSEETHVGPFRPGRVTLYFFEDEWAEVHDFSSVKLYGVEYFRQETLTPVTLWDVTLRVVQVGVEDRP